jgi:SAM-dependent methyltransferase
VATDEYNFPIQADSYDLVLSGQVIEHVRKIWTWMREVARVCKPGGLVITLNPVNWPYHAHPHDCWRIFPEGMRALYEDAGLSVELSHFGSLELSSLRYVKWQRSIYRTLVAVFDRAVGRRSVWGPALDTITVGRKAPAGPAATP